MSKDAKQIRQGIGPGGPTGPGGPIGWCGIGNGIIGAITAIGWNFWTLLQLMVASSIPMIIPLLIFKVILIGIKIYKIFKIVKFLIKIFVLIPFLTRVVYPMVVDFFNNHQSVISHLKSFNSDVFYSNETMKSLNFDDYGNYTRVSSCASKFVCEFGVFLAKASAGHVPKKVGDFFERKAEEAEELGKIGHEQNAIGQIYNAFIIALGKKWSQEQCDMFSCDLIL